MISTEAGSAEQTFRGVATWTRQEVDMQDSSATIMIVRALQEIAAEVRAIHEELHQLNQLGRRGDADPLASRQDHPDLARASAHPIKRPRLR